MLERVASTVQKVFSGYGSLNPCVLLLGAATGRGAVVKFGSFRVKLINFKFFTIMSLTFLAATMPLLMVTLFPDTNLW